MTARVAAGIISTVAGALGLIAVLAAKHGESLRGMGSARLLTLAGRMGIIHEPLPGAVDEMKAPVLLPYTDETALQIALGYGVYLGIAAMLWAFVAARRREGSLYAGAGFTCGWLSLVAANFTAGMMALIVGGALMLWATANARNAR